MTGVDGCVELGIDGVGVSFGGNTGSVEGGGSSGTAEDERNGVSGIETSKSLRIS